MCDTPEARLIFPSLSEGDTDRLGTVMAACLRAGDIVALNGELGAGKTRLVRAIVGVFCPADDRASSPTYVLLQTYVGPTPVYHFDAYRLADADEFLELGPEEFFAGEGVCLIEWASRVESALPADHLRIDIRVTGPHTREFQFIARGERSMALLKQIESRLQATESPI
jgi:tRNA threonylcarbamoyladenosine biosynthesis protein TsaE